MHNVAKLNAGNEHSVALTKNSELYIWGNALCTGMNDTEDRTVPTQHEFFKNLKISQVACGGLHTTVLTKDGEVYTWGSTEGG
jgi:alpha-tubulin suppressor-like RCC1 family protein